MRIAIVNDDENARALLRRVIENQTECSVAWESSSGAEALETLPCDPPDAILMDLHMEGLDGVETTRKIMAIHSCPIIIVASSVEDNPSMVFEAMGNGAIDAVSVPVQSEDGTARGEENLIKKLRTIQKLIDPKKLKITSKPNLDPSACELNLPDIIAIGTSTGGPKALGTILSQLPSEFESAIVIVQHVDPKFTQGLVEWLGGQSTRPVSVAADGAPIEKGHVYIAGTESHLVIRDDLRFGYKNPDPSDIYKPSVDILFHSLAARWPQPGTAVILTGMGRDGAKGLLALKQAGWRAIAQDQASSVVYGMPKAAVKLEAVDLVLPLDQIAHELNRIDHQPNLKPKAEASHE